MCRSVPQIPVHSTRIFTSLIPGDGSGTFSSHNPSAARLFTKAFILDVLWRSRSAVQNHEHIRYSRSARFMPAAAGILTLSVALRRGGPAGDFGLRLDFSILETA